MSKELIDRLKSYIPSGDGHNSQYANDLAYELAARTTERNGLRVSLDATVLRAESLAAELEHANQWRDLAMQFDQHRMRAIALLKLISAGEADSWDAGAFLCEPPTQGCQLNAELQELRAELAAIKGQEPVLYVNGEHLALMLDNPDKEGRSASASTVKGHYCDTPLYTTPQPSAVPDGWKPVPVEPTEAMMLNESDCKHHAWDDKSCAARKIRFGIWAKMLAAAPSAPATVQGDGWIPVSERLPESERTVLAFYLNSHGKGRRVRAEYIAAKTKSADDGWDSDEPADYDEQADEYFWPAGWYEVMDNWDDLTHMVIHEGEVTHWMPLPAAPAIAAARQEGGKV